MLIVYIFYSLFMTKSRKKNHFYIIVVHRAQRHVFVIDSMSSCDYTYIFTRYAWNTIKISTGPVAYLPVYHPREISARSYKRIDLKYYYALVGLRVVIYIYYVTIIKIFNGLKKEYNREDLREIKKKYTWRNSHQIIFLFVFGENKTLIDNWLLLYLTAEGLNAVWQCDVMNVTKPENKFSPNSSTKFRSEFFIVIYCFMNLKRIHWNNRVL